MKSWIIGHGGPVCLREWVAINILRLALAVMSAVVAFVTFIAMDGIFIGVAHAQQSAGQSSGISDDPDDGKNILREIQERRRAEERNALIPRSPLGRLRDGIDRGKERLYEATRLKLGFAFNHLYQEFSDALPREDHGGTSSDFDILGSWELVHQGKPDQGELFFGIEGRWDYGTIAPQTLSGVALGSLIQTANAFTNYVPTFIVRNLYWEQGTPKAGWVYRIGKITPDAIVSTSKHLSPVATFHTAAGTGGFATPLPDSGLGVAGVVYLTDYFKILGVFSDSNGDRFNFGDFGAGDYFKALEFSVKIAPRTEKAGFSKLTIMHSDGTKDGQPINANTGRPGWGVLLKHEQELTDDGRAIMLLRYGFSTNRSAIYNQQASVQFLLYDPIQGDRLNNDVIGIGYNWIEPSAIGGRDEHNVEVFYRFPLFPKVDTTLSYQSVINPALAPTLDHSSVFGLRMRTTF